MKFLAIAFYQSHYFSGSFALNGKIVSKPSEFILSYETINPPSRATAQFIREDLLYLLSHLKSPDPVWVQECISCANPCHDFPNILDL